MAWEKVKFISAGSYGSVYLAKKKKLSFKFSSIAVKSVEEINRGSMAALQVEKIMLQQFRGCPYIIQALGYDVSSEQGNLVHNLMLEFAKFGSLADIIKSGQQNIPESVVALYAYMIMRGLAILHDKDIIHCDIKPNNILVFDLLSNSESFYDNGISFLKIADFGSAKKESSDDGVQRCTQAYASPELVLYGIQGKSSDIWAFGLTVASMIKGKSSWSRNQLFKYGSEGLRIPQHTSPMAVDFLKKCLEKDCSQRWTVDMLLKHPFIVKNLEMSGIEKRLLRREKKEAVKFVNAPWISAQNLFSDSKSSSANTKSSGGNSILKDFFKLFLCS